MMKLMTVCLISVISVSCATQSRHEIKLPPPPPISIFDLLPKDIIPPPLEQPPLPDDIERGLIQWHSDIDESIETAKRLRMPIMLYVGSKTCNSCEKFEKNVLTIKSITDFVNEQYVPIKLDFEEGLLDKRSQQMLISLNISIIPHTSVLESDAQFEIARISGTQSPDAYFFALIFARSIFDSNNKRD